VRFLRALSPCRRGAIEDPDVGNFLDRFDGLRERVRNDVDAGEVEIVVDHRRTELGGAILGVRGGGAERPRSGHFVDADNTTDLRVGMRPRHVSSARQSVTAAARALRADARIVRQNGSLAQVLNQVATQMHLQISCNKTSNKPVCWYGRDFPENGA
jgi:hypothetical protein